MVDAVIHIDPLDEGLHFLFPEEWNELSRKQLTEIAGILFTETDPLMADTKMANAIIRHRIFTYTSPAVIIEHILPLIEWIKIDCSLTKQLLPTLSVGLRKFYGPDDGLSNIRLVEFDFAERELYAWHQDRKNMMQLFRFIACLYRPKKNLFYNVRRNKDGDARGKFNDNLVQHYAELLSKHVPLEEAYAILLWYKGCRDTLQASCPNVFSSSDNSTAGESAEPSYFGIMRMIAEKGTYGNLEQVEQLYLTVALMEMELTIIEHKQSKEIIDA